jgi:hypothetical protein
VNRSLATDAVVAPPAAEPAAAVADVPAPPTEFVTGDADVIPLRPHGGASTRGNERRAHARAHHPAGRDQPNPGRPDPARLAALLVRVAGEVAAGRRPVSQLEPLLAPALIRRLSATLRAAGPRPTAELSVRDVRTAPPTPSGAVEATVLVERDGRTGAIAVRLECHRGGWRATELTAPESGYPPMATASDARPARRRPDAFDEAAAEAEAEAGFSRCRGSV